MRQCQLRRRLVAAAVRTTAAMLGLAGLGFLPTAHAEPLNPLDFTSLGTLNLSDDSFTINTDTLEVRDSLNNLLFTGVLSNQNGLADSYGPGGSLLSVGPNGIPHVAVFAFGSISIDNTAAITVTGHRALALLSQTNATIDTSIELRGLDGESVPSGAGAGGAGGSGGFAGGDITHAAGGPGGGQPNVSGGPSSPLVRGGGGSFGGRGVGATDPTTGAAGVTYGDLTLVLQGGSGGGEAHTTGINSAAGAGGGGALEIGAVGSLLLGPSAGLDVTGGLGGDAPNGTNTMFGGSGSAGGIRLSAASIENQGVIMARGGGTVANQHAVGGGGRVLVYGILPSFVLGQDTLDLAVLNIDVQSGADSDTERGVVTFAPQTAIVPNGTTVRLGQLNLIQPASVGQARIELVNRDVILHSGGQANVGAAGYLNRNVIEMQAGSSIVGTGVLTNNSVLRGSGAINVTVINGTGGQINALNDTLVFAQPVTNASGQITANSSTLNFDAGLSQQGAMSLTDSVVNGAVTTATSIAVSGAATFNGAVAGPGAFSGPASSTVVFNHSYSPGSSTGTVGFAGHVTFATPSTLNIQLGGHTPGTEYDRLVIAGSLTAGGGTLAVSTINGFVPLPGDTFDVIFYGSRTGSFGVTNETGLGLNFTQTFSATSLRLTAAAMFAGDANLDGQVDIDDLKILATNWQAPADNWLDADFDGNGLTDLFDLGILASNWQAGVSAPGLGPTSLSLTDAATSLGLAAASVPEPAALGLILILPMPRG